MTRRLPDGPRRLADVPANDDTDGAITMDDVLILACLVVIFVGTLGLLADILLDGSNDVAALLRR